ncbi:MAG: oligosaccharide flippase family protein [Hyphomicrobiales bacterium]
MIVNFFSLSVIEVIAKLSPWITLPYVTYIIGLEKFGLVTFADAFAAYFLTIVDYGFAFSATRDVSKNRENKNKVKEIYSNVFSAKIILLLVAVIIYFSLIKFIPSLNSNFELYLFSFFVVIANLFYPKYLFQGLEDMKFIAIFDVSTQILRVIAIFLFLKNADDYILVPLFTGGSAILAGVFATCFIYIKYSIYPKAVPVKTAFSELKNGFNIFINQLLPNLYTNTSTVLLKIICSESVVGIYGAAQKVIGIGVSLLSVLSKVFFPRIAKSNTRFNNYKKLISIFSVIIVIGYLLLSKPLFHVLFTSEFYEGIPLTYIMAIGFFGLALYDCYGINGLIQIGKSDKLVRSTLYASLIGLVSAFVLIYFFGAIGAAITITLTRILMGTGAFMFYNKKIF